MSRRDLRSGSLAVGRYPVEGSSSRRLARSGSKRAGCRLRTRTPAGFSVRSRRVGRKGQQCGDRNQAMSRHRRSLGLGVDSPRVLFLSLIEHGRWRERPLAPLAKLPSPRRRPGQHWTEGSRSLEWGGQRRRDARPELLGERHPSALVEADSSACRSPASRRSAIGSPCRALATSRSCRSDRAASADRRRSSCPRTNGTTPLKAPPHGKPPGSRSHCAPRAPSSRTSRWCSAPPGIPAGPASTS